jgi:hypothetical protein
MIPPAVQIAILLFGIVVSVFAMTFQFMGASYLFLFAEGFFIGGWQAYTLLLTLERLNNVAFNPIMSGAFAIIFPVIIGFLSFARLTKYRWLSRYYMAVIGGSGAGIIVGTVIKTDVLALIKTTSTDLVKLTPNAIVPAVIMIGMISSLTYFLYAQRIGSLLHSATGRLRWVTILGRVFLMTSFGYLYAQVFVSEGMEQLIQGIIIVFKTQVDKILFLLK